MAVAFIKATGTWVAAHGHRGPDGVTGAVWLTPLPGSSALPASGIPLFLLLFVIIFWQAAIAARLSPWRSVRLRGRWWTGPAPIVSATASGAGTARRIPVLLAASRLCYFMPPI